MFVYNFRRCNHPQVVKLQYLIRQVLEKAVDACFGPVMFTKRFVVRKMLMTSPLVVANQLAYLGAVKGHSGHHLAEKRKPMSSVNL